MINPPPIPANEPHVPAMVPIAKESGPIRLSPLPLPPASVWCTGVVLFFGVARPPLALLVGVVLLRRAVLVFWWWVEGVVSFPGPREECVFVSRTQFCRLLRETAATFWTVEFRRQEDIILKTTACHFMCDLLDEQNYLYFKSKTTVNNDRFLTSFRAKCDVK